MKQIYSLFTVLFLLSILLFSCSEENEEGCDIIKSAENNKYSVVIDSGSSAESRAITDLVQGGGNYSEGSLVKLYTKDRKFMATAVGSAGTTWLQNGDPNSTTILTSSINQDWSVAIKYYSDVILDCTAPGGDGSKVTKALEVGSQLPDPVVTAGYTFEGWYEGGTRVYIVPESSNRTFTAKFKLARFLIAGEEGYIVTIMGTNPTVAVDIKQIGKNAWNTITYGNEKYVAVGYDSYITYSIDGVIWESPSHTSWGTDYIRIAYGNGRFAIVKEPSTAATVSVTSDFIDYNGSLYESGSFVYDIAYGKNKFVGVGSRSGLGIAYVLNDGSSKWSSYYKVIVGSIKSIIFDGNQFVTLNNSGYVSTSSNGTSWSEQGYTGTYFLTNMAYGNGIYVGCGDGGYVSMSNDCTIWTTPKRIGTNKWLAVTYGGGLFLMVGEKGYISSSSD